MFRSLTIENYALIQNLHIDFDRAVNIITGETGAGKSILLGALQLLLGQRADIEAIGHNSDKCVLEAVFETPSTARPLLQAHDLDDDAQLVLRREITPSGKSRSFLNDTPVKLQFLQEISSHIIDIHSQYETANLTDAHFQMQTLDLYAHNQEHLQLYRDHLKSYSDVLSQIHETLEKKEALEKAFEYNQYLLEELDQANLIAGELPILEEEQKRLSHIHEVVQHLGESRSILNQDEHGVVSLLRSVRHSMDKTTEILSESRSISQRLESIHIELQDIFNEIDTLVDQQHEDPERLEYVRERMSMLYTLLRKHKVETTDELITIQENLSKEVKQTQDIDRVLTELEKQSNQLKQNLDNLALQIYQRRLGAVDEVSMGIQNILVDLGMPEATLNIRITATNEYFDNGKDKVQFLFSANKGHLPQDMSKVASGGERSRLMLAIKNILSYKDRLPTIIFDEIDTGVSGNIASKMGNIMHKMGENMQVIVITHLAQIASKGQAHFKVYKENEGEQTYTQMVRLSHEQRIHEIAEMLSGESLSEHAIEQARSLLG